MWRPTPSTSWPLSLSGRLCGRHGRPPALPPPISRASSGQRPLTCVPRRARTPAEGARGCAFHGGSWGRASPPTVQTMLASWAQKAGLQPYAAARPLLSGPLDHARRTPDPDPQIGCAPALHAPHGLL